MLPSAHHGTSSLPTAAVKPSRPPLLDLLYRLASSSVGAVAVVLVTSPLDVLKTRRQAAAPPAPPPPLSLTLSLSSPPLQRGTACRREGSALSLLASPPRPRPRPPPPPPSGLRALSALVRREGVRVLWSGLRPALAATVPATALYFTTYDLLKARAERALAGSAAQPAAPLLAGVAGRVLAVAAVSPLELIRTREMLKRSRRPLLAALRAEVAAGGSIAALWRGFAATLWRDVPFSGIYWLGYENLKRTGERALAAARSGAAGGGGGGGGGGAARQPRILDTVAISFAAGATSGSVAALVTTPFDVLRTRQQVAGMAGAAATARGGTVAALADIARSEGLAGLFAGVGARVAKVAPSCAIMISSFELCKRLLLLD